MTLSEVARRAGISENALFLYEGTAWAPKPCDLLRIAKALGCRPDELIATGPDSEDLRRGAKYYYLLEPYLGRQLTIELSIARAEMVSAFPKLYSDLPTLKPLASSLALVLSCLLFIPAPAHNPPATVPAISIPIHQPPTTYITALTPVVKLYNPFSSTDKARLQDAPVQRRNYGPVTLHFRKTANALMFAFGLLRHRE